MLINKKKYCKSFFGFLVFFYAFIFFSGNISGFGRDGKVLQTPVKLYPGLRNTVKKYFSDAGFSQHNYIAIADTTTSSNTTEQFFNNDKSGQGDVVYRRIIASDGVIVYEWWVKTGATPLAVDFKAVNTNKFDVAVTWSGPIWNLNGQAFDDVKPGYKLNPNYGLNVTGYADLFGPNEQKDARTHGRSSQRSLPLAGEGIWLTNWLSFSAPMGDFAKQKLSYKISDFKVLVKQNGRYVDIKKAKRLINDEYASLNKNTNIVFSESKQQIEGSINIQQKLYQQLTLLEEQSQKQIKAWQIISNRVLLVRDAIIINMSQQNLQAYDLERSEQFTELKELVRTKNGILVICSHCTGKGFKTCEQCNAAGYYNCTNCEHTGKVKCSLCGGTKLFHAKTCTQCQGAGYQECTSCSGKGKTVCQYCGGLGNIQCSQCRGTGKQFKQDSLEEKGG